MAHNNSGANNVAFEFLCRWRFPLPKALWAVKKCPFFAAAPLPRGEGRASPSCSHVLSLLMEMVVCPAASSAPAQGWSRRAGQSCGAPGDRDSTRTWGWACWDPRPCLVRGMRPAKRFPGGVFLTGPCWSCLSPSQGQLSGSWLLLGRSFSWECVKCLVLILLHQIRLEWAGGHSPQTRPGEDQQTGGRTGRQTV